MSRAGNISRVTLGAARTSAGWIRGIGWDEDATGRLDRDVLDGIRADVPVRVQHRSGALWVLNSRGAEVLGLDDETEPGIERDETGRATGRLWRMDRWLRDRIGADPPDLAAVSTRLASTGITGVTDASPDLDGATVDLLSAGHLRQHLVLLGTEGSDAGRGRGHLVGPRKIVVSDHALPAFDDLCQTIRTTRPRPVAVHCVTRAGLVLTLAALAAEGTVRGDRIEHAAVAPLECVSLLAELSVAVVTQPSLVALRGDDYLDRVDPEDRDLLWPFRSLIEAGVEVGCSSDAPYGDLDPWRTIRAATERTTRSGRVVGARERVSARQGLDGFLSEPQRPGGPPRTVRPGAAADLVVLTGPLADILRSPNAAAVRSTVIGGRVVHEGG